MGKNLGRTIPVEGGEARIICNKGWRSAWVGFVLTDSPYRLTREQQDAFRSLLSTSLVTSDAVMVPGAPAKEAESLADYFEAFISDRVLPEPPLEGAELEEAQRNPDDEMPKPGEFFIAYKVAGYVLWDGYDVWKAIKQTTRDVNAGKEWVAQMAASKVVRWVASGSPERPTDLPSHMIEEREALETCLLQVVDLGDS